jgi:hypothetical protein
LWIAQQALYIRIRRRIRDVVPVKDRQCVPIPAEVGVGLLDGIEDLGCVFEPGVADLVRQQPCGSVDRKSSIETGHGDEIVSVQRTQPHGFEQPVTEETTSRPG